jgi:hypothetical protein
MYMTELPKLWGDSPWGAVGPRGGRELFVLRDIFILKEIWAQDKIYILFVTVLG